MKDKTSNQQPTDRLSPADIVAGAADGTFKHGDSTFKHGDKFKMNNGFTDYDARLTIETDGSVNLTEIDLGFPLKQENQKKDWWKVTGESE